VAVDHRRREAKALGIMSEIVPRDVGTNIALAKESDAGRAGVI
jgi:hypothetical protein